MVLTNGGIDLTHRRTDMVVDHVAFVGGVDALTERLGDRLDRSVAVAHLALSWPSRIAITQIRSVQHLARVPHIVREDAGRADERRDSLVTARFHIAS